MGTTLAWQIAEKVAYGLVQLYQFTVNFDGYVFQNICLASLPLYHWMSLKIANACSRLQEELFWKIYLFITFIKKSKSENVIF